MSAFEDQVRAFAVKVEQRNATLFPNIVSAVQDSIVNGSPLTGAPGQPVGQYGPGYHQGKVGGDLKTSWQTVRESPEVAVVGTNSQHAVQNEYGISATGGPYIQRSTVGGRHSVALTVAGFDKLVAAEVAKVAK